MNLNLALLSHVFVVFLMSSYKGVTRTFEDIAWVIPFVPNAPFLYYLMFSGVEKGCPWE